MTEPTDVQLIRRAGYYISGAVTAASSTTPNSPAAWRNALSGTELSLKALLTKNGIQYEKTHKLEDLIEQIKHNSLLDAKDISELEAAVTAVNMSGSYVLTRYPENDPLFFESLQPSELQKRVEDSEVVYRLLPSILATLRVLRPRKNRW